MNSYPNSRLASYKLIVTEAKKEPKAISLIPTFAKGINRLEAINTELESLSVQQSVNNTGITQDKNAQMKKVIYFVIAVSGAVHSYAIGIGDKILQAKVNYNVTLINKINQSQLLEAAGVVLEETGKTPTEVVQ